MKTFYLLSLFLVCCTTLSAQELVRQRIADLQPLDYTIEGDAILEEFDDGSLKLRLSEDFTTPVGPDVRIFLSDSATMTGSVQVADLSALEHFSGARTFDVPEGVTLDQYSRIFFYCQAFRQAWAEGFLAEPTDIATSTIDRALARQVVVYPNPASSSLNISLPDNFYPSRVALLNTLGQTTRTQAFEVGPKQLQLDVSGLPKGQYVLRLEDGERLLSKRISVAR